MNTLPHSRDAEISVVGRCLADPSIVPEVMAVVQPEHFYVGATKLVFETIVEQHYADAPTDPLTVSERVGKRLANGWNIPEEEAQRRVQQWAADPPPGNLLDHAKLVKSHSDYRGLLKIADMLRAEVATEEKTPEQIAGIASQAATAVATSNTAIGEELVSFGDSGREFIRHLKVEMAAVQQGVEMGVYFGMPFLDNWTRGLRPGELLIGAGEPGVGKSMVFWRGAQLFAERQALKVARGQIAPGEKPIGTLVVSAEMSDRESNARLATALTGLDGGQIREAKIATGEFERIVAEWGKRKDIPLWFNYRSHLRLSQLKALVTEAIRQHNVGLVVVDHFRHLDSDRRVDDPNERDEIRARFLKEQIAKDLNVAVVCIAHSAKMREGRRPILSDLRGSGQIAAAADIVGFVYRPYIYASEKAKDAGEVSPHEAEFIYAKNRNGPEGIADFTFDPSTVTVY